MEKSSTGNQGLEKSLLGEPSESVFSSKEPPSQSNLRNMFRGVFQLLTGPKSTANDRYQAMSDSVDDKNRQSKESCVIG